MRQRSFTLRNVDGLAGLFSAKLSASLVADPTDQIAIVRRGAAGRELLMVKWGMYPHWAKVWQPLAPRYANANTLETKPTFQDAFKSRRCLVVVDGYSQNDQRRLRHTHFFELPDKAAFAIAGLWDNGKGVDSACMIVTEPFPSIKAISTNMPLILCPNDYDAWLAPETERDAVVALLTPKPITLTHTIETQ